MYGGREDPFTPPPTHTHTTRNHAEMTLRHAFGGAERVAVAVDVMTVVVVVGALCGAGSGSGGTHAHARVCVCACVCTRGVCCGVGQGVVGRGVSGATHYPLRARHALPVKHVTHLSLGSLDRSVICSRQRAVLFFGRVFFLISPAHSHVRTMGRTCTWAGEIELTPIGVGVDGWRGVARYVPPPRSNLAPLMRCRSSA